MVRSSSLNSQGTRALSTRALSRGALLRNVLAAALVLALALQEGVAAAQADPPGERPGPFSFSAEALIWWFKSSPTPVPIIANAPLTLSDSKVLLGGGNLDTNPNPGFRLTAGYALYDRWGLEGNFLYVPPRSTSNSVSSSGHLGSTDMLLPF